MSETNERIVLARRPTQRVTREDFRLERVPMPQPRDGEVLVRNHYLSVDPYMRGRISDQKSYAAPQPLDEVMIGGTVGEVIESRDSRFRAGDRVFGMLGWQQYGVCDASALRRIDERIPMSAHLGVAGMPGVTAWYGVNRILEPRAGQTLVVSAASGAVGSVVGQLAKAIGCRVVGIAGGERKCAAVVEEFGFDACVDYKAGRLREDLRAAVPDGVDAYFENVGGEILDAVLARMNPFGRIAVCGLIAGYDGDPIPVHNFRSVLTNRLRIQGFIISEQLEVWPQALRELAEGVAAGRLRYRESVSQGLDSAPDALIGLLHGANFGKQVVRLI